MSLTHKIWHAIKYILILCHAACRISLVVVVIAVMANLWYGPGTDLHTLSR